MADFKPRKYLCPEFLTTAVQQVAYERWLSRRAAAHFKRDKKRSSKQASLEAFKEAIHKAVCASGGRDFYTGEELNWSLISKYNNIEAKAGGRIYKKGFAYLPSVDHVGGPCDLDFRICSWQTNDSKNDLTHQEFLALCRTVIAHFERNN